MTSTTATYRNGDRVVTTDHGVGTVRAYLTDGDFLVTPDDPAGKPWVRVHGSTLRPAVSVVKATRRTWQHGDRVEVLGSLTAGHSLPGHWCGWQGPGVVAFAVADGVAVNMPDGTTVYPYADDVRAYR